MGYGTEDTDVGAFFADWGDKGLRARKPKAINFIDEGLL
jgi:hypothetical protein